MAINYDYQTLTTLINDIEVQDPFLVRMVYGGGSAIRPVISETYKVRIFKGNEKILPFVGKTEGGTLIQNTLSKQQTVDFPRLRPKKFIPAKDLRTQNYQEIYTPGAGTVGNNADFKIMTESDDMKNRMLMSMELMVAQTLQGYTNIVDDEKNQIDYLDFQMPATHKLVLDAALQWDGVDVDIPSQILEYKMLVAKTGREADVLVVGHDVAFSILKNKPVLEILNKINVNVGNIRTEMDKKEKRAIYLATIHGVEIWSYTRTYLDSNNDEQYYIPVNAVSLFASEAEREAVSGIVIDNEAQVNSTFFEKGWEEKDPSGVFLLAESRPLFIPVRVEAQMWLVVQ